MMKRTLFESEPASVARVRNVTNVAAALLLALSTGCVSEGGREAGAASASKAVAVARAAPAEAETVAGVRRVQVSGEGAEPSVAAAADGSVYVAWVAHRPNKEADVFLSRFDREGAPQGSAVRVNPAAGVATAWRGDPPDVAVAPDGAVYVVWTARAAGAEHATTLYLSASRDGGRSFDAPVKVNDDARACVHGMHSLAVGADGRVYVAWLDERDIEPKKADPSKAPSHMHTESNRAVYFAASADGGRAFTFNRKVAAEACPCCKTALAISGDGRVYVGWRQVMPGDFRHVAVAASDDGGDTFAAPSIVSDDRWELRGCPVSGPALAAGEGGALRVLWYTAGEAGPPGLYSAESADGGRTFAPRLAVTEGSLRGTPLLLRDGRGLPLAVYEGVSESGSRALWRVGLGEATGATGGAAPVAGGESVAATARDGRLHVAYVAKGGVWLAQSDGVE
ncbi:MAG TPA: sialidase family protein [Pyrinomonadaceae bacterium]